MHDPKDQRALAIVTKYKLLDKVSQSVREVLWETKPRKTAADARVDQQTGYKFVQQFVMASNADAMECMATEVFRLGLTPLKLNSTCSGSVDKLAQEYARLASLLILTLENKITRSEMYEQMKGSPVCPSNEQTVWEMIPTRDTWSLGLCLLLGGRPTVQLCERPGKNGPNQELALRFSLYWSVRTEEHPILRGYTVWFVGGSSRGRDGNTRAAGAFGYRSLATDVHSEYEKASDTYDAACRKWKLALQDKQSESEITVRSWRGNTARFISLSRARLYSRIRRKERNIETSRRGKSMMPDNKREREIERNEFSVQTLRGEFKRELSTFDSRREK